MICITNVVWIRNMHCLNWLQIILFCSEFEIGILVPQGFFYHSRNTLYKVITFDQQRRQGFCFATFHLFDSRISPKVIHNFAWNCGKLAHGARKNWFTVYTDCPKGGVSVCQTSHQRHIWMDSHNTMKLCAYQQGCVEEFMSSHCPTAVLIGHVVPQ